VNASRVIQFGEHGRKRTSNINCVSLERFASEDRVEVVTHGKKTRWFEPYTPEGDPPGRIVERAEWLLANHPVGRYNALGWNCEHAAYFCVHEYAESYQARRILDYAPLLFFAVATVAEARKPPPPDKVGHALIRALALSRLLDHTYRRHKACFWRTVGREWDAYTGGECRKYSYLAERPVAEILAEVAERSRTAQSTLGPTRDYDVLTGGDPRR
jgi:hypothetical protein